MSFSSGEMPSEIAALVEVVVAMLEVSFFVVVVVVFECDRMRDLWRVKRKERGSD